MTWRKQSNDDEDDNDDRSYRVYDEIFVDETSMDNTRWRDLVTRRSKKLWGGTFMRLKKIKGIIKKNKNRGTEKPKKEFFFSGKSPQKNLLIKKLLWRTPVGPCAVGHRIRGPQLRVSVPRRLQPNSTAGSELIRRLWWRGGKRFLQPSDLDLRNSCYPFSVSSPHLPVLWSPEAKWILWGPHVSPRCCQLHFV